MRDISRRIKKVEKRLRIGPKPELDDIILGLSVPPEIAQFIPEDVKEWITYQKAHREALERLERTGCGLFMFVADPKKEYEAQQATENNQKQPILRKQAVIWSRQSKKPN